MNYSKEDPWWKNRLLSQNLFTRLTEIATKEGQLLSIIDIGNLFKFQKLNRTIHIYTDPKTVIVADLEYATEWSIFDEVEDFKSWRNKIPTYSMAVGKRIDRCVYAASKKNNELYVSWVQAGAWALY